MLVLRLFFWYYISTLQKVDTLLSRRLAGFSTFLTKEIIFSYAEELSSALFFYGKHIAKKTS